MNHSGNPLFNLGAVYQSRYLPPPRPYTFWPRHKRKIIWTIGTCATISMCSVIYHDLARRWRIIDIARHNSRLPGSYFNTYSNQQNEPPPGYYDPGQEIPINRTKIR